jgi:hypothetical protein
MAACFLAPVAPALAQGGLPAAVVQAQSIGPEQQSQIQQYVADPLKNLGSDDNDVIKEARSALLQPLRTPGISVSFRQAYSSACMPRLRELTTGSRDQVVANAIRVIADLGTPESLELLGKLLTDKRPDNVRLVAASSCARVFEILNRGEGTPAVLPGDVQGLIDRLGDCMADNGASPDVLDAVIRSLMPGMKPIKAGFEAVRAKAIDVLCKQIIAKSKSPAAWPIASQALPALLRGQEALRDLLGEANPRNALSEDQTKLVTAVQGRLITWIAENLKEVQPGPTRDLAERSIRVGETACTISLEALGVHFQAAKMADDFKANTPERDRQFFDKATQLRRLLEDPPLNLGPLGRP